VSEAKHTPGPWRWEFNPDANRLALVGGEVRYDLKLLDFVRWGMQGGIARFRDPAFPNLNVMELPNKWAVPEKGREHHAERFNLIDHPDANLIAAAPDLLAACEKAEGFVKYALEFWDWRNFPNLEESAQLLLKQLQEAKAKAGAA